MMAEREVANILVSEFNEEFIQGMRDRMVVSYYKYGPISEAYPDKVNAISSLQDRLRMYAETGNIEYLIDAANFAMIEFMLPRHPKAFFKPTDDDGSPGRISLRTGSRDKRDNNEIGTNPNSITAKFR